MEAIPEEEMMAISIDEHEALLALLLDEIENEGPVNVSELLLALGFDALVAEAHAIAEVESDEDLTDDPDADDIDDADPADASDASDAEGGQ